MANALQNERLQRYLEAEKAVLKNQSYTIGGRTYTRANLADIRKAIDDLVAAGATVGDEAPVRAGSVKRVVFMDY